MPVGCRSGRTRAGAARSTFDPRLERGQALVETALVTPILLLLAFGIVAVGRVSQAQLGLGAATREAARSGALAKDRDAAVLQGTARGAEIARGYGLTNGSLVVSVDASAFARGGRVRAAGRYEIDMGDLPLLGWARVPLESGHTEWIDAYRSRPADAGR